MGLHINRFTSGLYTREERSELPKVRVTRCHSQDATLGPVLKSRPFSTQRSVAPTRLGHS